MTVMPAASTSLLDAALNYATALHLEVFPANPATKAPLVEHGMKDATTDADVIIAWWHRWPDALVACRIPIDRVVIDIDPRHGGLDTWGTLQAELGPIMATRVHASGRGDGGAHHWFTRPQGQLTARKLHEWAREHGTGHATGKHGWTSGLDLLHHNHRYSILPPSPHPTTGQPYVWVMEQVAEAMPAYLQQLIIADPPPPAPPPRLRQVLDGDSIADWYTTNHTWNEILEPSGWVVVEGGGDEDGSKWRHPNASAESSASIRNGCLFVYSDNTDFDTTEEGSPNGYTRFRAWAILEHDADLSRAAHEARATKDGITFGGLLGRQSSSGGIVDAFSRQPAANNETPQANNDEDWDARDVVELGNRIAAGDYAPEKPEYLDVDGGFPLLYPGRVHSIFGEPAGGKTWVALTAVAERLKHGEHVLFIDWEDSPQGTVTRLLALGCNTDDLALLDYRNPVTGLARGWKAIHDNALPWTLIVIDSTGEAMAAGGVDSNVDGPVAEWMALAKRLARTGAAVLLLDHVPKNVDNRDMEIGSQRKQAAITGASYRCDTILPPAKGRDGKLRLVVRKDRLGNRSKGSTAAEVHILEAAGPLRIELRVSESQAAADRGERFRPTHLMERVSRWLEINPASTRRMIEDGVTGKREAIRIATDVLVEEGWVKVVKVGQSHEHTVVKDYRETLDLILDPGDNSGVPHRAPPCPSRAPGEVQDKRAPRAPAFVDTQDGGTVRPPNQEAETDDRAPLGDKSSKQSALREFWGDEP